MREQYKVKIPLHLESMRIRDVDREVKKQVLEVVLYADSHAMAQATVHGALISALEDQLRATFSGAAIGREKQNNDDPED